MPEFEYRSGVEVTPDVVYDWHEKPGAFDRLLPPWENVRIVERRDGLAVGDGMSMEIRVGPLKKLWIARIAESEPGVSFVDEQVEGPFASWTHRHRFVPEARKFCLMEDTVQYRLPYGPFGVLADGYVRKRLERMFYFRHDRIRYDISRLRVLKRKLGTQRVAVTGASGLIGRELVNYLRAGGFAVQRFVRRPVEAADEIRWDPTTGEIDAAALEGVDVVVHLAGENIGARKWTPAFKEQIRLSRFESTRLLSQTMARLAHKPHTFISASAIGYYGDRGDETLTEASEAGRGFLAEVCKSWERETDAAAQAGIRVVNARIGIVISARGGMLAKLLPLFRWGLGGRLGDGRHHMAWVSLEDVIGAISFLMAEKDVSGPVNVTAPHPVTNADLTRILAGVLHRPALGRVPAFVIRRMGEKERSLAMQSARVEPAKLRQAGFRYIHPELWGALCHELGIRTVMA